MSATMLLVHGGHHGAWVWEKLQKELAEQGWASATVDLPSAVRDTSAPEPLPGVHDDALVIRDAIDAIHGPVVVVAHSYAGVPVTEATAGAANVTHLVYVAAYVPDIGESMFGAHGIPTPPTLAGLRPAENPDLNLPGAFYDGDLNNPDTAAAIARLVPQTVRGDFETVTRAAWHTIPSSYVIPENDISITATVAERMAARTGAVHRVPGHHAPFYSNPKEFAALLTRIA
ncbi:Alpha/beta hydrolase family protein [Asanoa ishikariensis]|uniref:Alpha/beta hydrolase family protein n=2 Tax=Asanoa ishikariensis TaxID=137265 RepID=A0A1H3S898_9ACTN|nr:Alpha/beta hydrolase family protein [Asanoa ishikariensis]